MNEQLITAEHIENVAFLHITDQEMLVRISIAKAILLSWVPDGISLAYSPSASTIEISIGEIPRSLIKLDEGKIYETATPFDTEHQIKRAEPRPVDADLLLVLTTICSSLA